MPPWVEREVVAAYLLYLAGLAGSFETPCEVSRLADAFRTPHAADEETTLGTHKLFYQHNECQPNHAADS